MQKSSEPCSTRVSGANEQVYLHPRYLSYRMSSCLQDPLVSAALRRCIAPNSAEESEDGEDALRGTQREAQRDSP